MGDGWLREAPRASAVPRAWDVRSRSALRKCMFLPVPPELLAKVAEAEARQARPSEHRAPKPESPPASVAPAPVRRDPSRFARELPAVDPRAIRASAREPAPPAFSWWEDPVAVGSILLFAPPIGLALLWTSRRYSTDARWALTVMTALTMCLTTSVLVAIILLQR